VLEEPLAGGSLVVGDSQRFLNVIHRESHIDERVDGVLRRVRLLVLLAVEANDFQQPFNLLLNALRMNGKKENI